MSFKILDSVNFTHELPDVVPRRDHQQRHLHRQRLSSSGSASHLHRDPDFLDRSVRQRNASDGNLKNTAECQRSPPTTLERLKAGHRHNIKGLCHRQLEAELGSDTPSEEQGVSAEELNITSLPSIPQRSTYRVHLPPDEVLPPCK